MGAGVNNTGKNQITQKTRRNFDTNIFDAGNQSVGSVGNTGQGRKL
jgi:hypothetical protein